MRKILFGSLLVLLLVACQTDGVVVTTTPASVIEATVQPVITLTPFPDIVSEEESAQVVVTQKFTIAVNGSVLTQEGYALIHKYIAIVIDSETAYHHVIEVWEWGILLERFVILSNGTYTLSRGGMEWTVHFTDTMAPYDELSVEVEISPEPVPPSAIPVGIGRAT